MKTRRGFPVIEVLILVTLAVMFGGVSLAPDRSSVRRAREAVLKEDLFRMRDAMDQSDHGLHRSRGTSVASINPD